MKIKLLSICFFVLLNTLNAQTWSWASGSIISNSFQDSKSNAIATDAVGNSYITGGFTSSSLALGSVTLTNVGGRDFFICKYDVNGNVVWAKSVGSNGSSDDEGSAITIDKNGDILVCGRFGNNLSLITFGTSTLTSANGNCFLAKYDASGNVLWAKSFGGTPGLGMGISSDSNADIYITGNFASTSALFGTITLLNINTNGDVYVAKYSSTGSAIWAKSINGVSTEKVNSLSIDAVGNVYITGKFSSSLLTVGTISLTNGGTSSNMFLVKYDTGGNVQWANAYGGANSVEATAIATDASGNSYVTGNFTNTFSLGTTTLSSNGVSDDLFVAKFDASGNVQWAKRAGGTYFEFPLAICIDGSSNLLIAGEFYSTTFNFGNSTLSNFSNANDVMLLKYNSTGTEIGGLSISSSLNYGSYATGVSIDATGNGYLTGSFNGPSTMTVGTISINNAGGSSLFIAKFNSSAISVKELIENKLSVKVYPNPTNGNLNISSNNFGTNPDLLTMKITDVVGNELLTEPAKENINISSLNSGIYFLSIYNNDRLIVSEKIIKE